MWSHLLLCQIVPSYAQTEGPISWNAYAEFYYGRDWRNPGAQNRPGYFMNHSRLNELAANLILIQGNYTDSLTRASFAWCTGTYTDRNMRLEPPWARNIYQASVGLKLHRTEEIWLDAGIFPSHLGAESPLGSKNMTLSRSLCAEGSPYYESGIDLNYTSSSQKWYFSLLFLNGWQNIAKVFQHLKPAIGTRIKYSGASWTINHGSFFGWTGPDQVRSFRTFQNVYAQYEGSESFSAQVGIDFGTEWVNRIEGIALFYTPYVIGRYQIAEKWSVSGRVERYVDEQEVNINLGANRELDLIGGSINLDYRMTPQGMCRLEWRQIRHEMEDHIPARVYSTLMASLCFDLN